MRLANLTCLFRVIKRMKQILENSGCTLETVVEGQQYEVVGGVKVMAAVCFDELYIAKKIELIPDHENACLKVTGVGAEHFQPNGHFEVIKNKSVCDL